MLKTLLISLIAASTTLICFSTSALSEALSAKWKDGLRWENEEGDIKLKFGGRIMNDWTFWLDADDELENEDTGVGSLDDSTEFRRARLYTAGKIYNLEYKAQYDFAGGDADFKDMYAGVTGIPLLGKIRVGHQYESFGLETLTSSKYITFLERGLTDAFSPGRNTGFRVLNHNKAKTLHWSVGVYKDSDNFGEGEGDSNYNITTRIAGAPYYEDDGKSLLHIGAAYSYKNLEDDEFRFRARPEIHDSPRFVDTGTIAAKSIHLVGTEAAFVCGSLSVQGEYVHSFVERDMLSDADFNAYYAFVSYFLTGEHRPYKGTLAKFGRVKPNSDYIAPDPGLGAWEVAFRYSSIDLDDSPVAGGELTDYTAGVNWYMHPNARIMLNFIYADQDDLGDAQAITTRFQVDF